ncbi:MAG TPA: G1 family glutamic endopeptidase [Streptosporangiaceae bacterium]|jgi:hypothetical protein|nr:G1 family glutamic endopeptidase [Streptosporangiaceae bacterium]
MLKLKAWLAAGSAVAAAGALIASGGAATVVAGGASTHAAYHRPSARFVSEARTALVRYLRHDHPTLMLAHTTRSHGSNAVTQSGSFNWSGYADTSTTAQAFTKVSGAWTTPSVTCSAEDQITSDWVGLDGATTGTVEQDGTIGWCYEGTATYFTWYEMYPAGTIEVGTTLAPGDKITASVTRAKTKYTLKLADATHTANSFTKSATCALATCLDESAEWIAERSSFSIGIAPLANYGTWKLTAGAETAGGTVGTIGSFATVTEFTMVDATDAYNLSVPTALTGGKAFNTTWKNSY